MSDHFCRNVLTTMVYQTSSWSFNKDLDDQIGLELVVK